MGTFELQLHKQPTVMIKKNSDIINPKFIPEQLVTAVIWSERSEPVVKNPDC